jgi:hypothetical protein
MADFVQNSETKNAVRELTSPIPDVATFNTIVQSVITDNPFGCITNMTPCRDLTHQLEVRKRTFRSILVPLDASWFILICVFSSTAGISCTSSDEQKVPKWSEIYCRF